MTGDESHMGKWGTIGIGILVLPAVCVAGEKINFNRDVRPILSDRCFHCHGPNEHDRQAELRLDRADGPEGAYRELYGTQAVKPGSLDGSELWRRITSGDDDVMPPPDSSKKPLTDEEKDIIKRWIEEDAEYAAFWSFIAPQRPPIPEVRLQKWNRQPIDQLVLRRLEQEGLKPKPTADRRTLIRRLSLDLTGLPPTRQEIRHFLEDTSSDAYENLVDRLLASPHYGEHMTKYWLDLVRFADTNGIHHDHYRDMTLYRDWVIRAFNQNQPYDHFVKDQLAGDLHAEPTHDQLIASGFNRLHLIIDRGTALPEESYTRNVVDRVTAVGTAFMGLTVQCAVCHDHKYDPITTKDFYQLFAFFNNLDAEPETGGRRGADFQLGLQPPYIRLSTDAQEAEIADVDRRVGEMAAQVQQIQKDSEEASDDEQKKNLAAELKKAKEALAQVQKEELALKATIPTAMVMKERADIRPAHILVRGQYDNPGDVVERNTPAFLPPMKESNKPRTRMDLAEWFVARENPLTARVAVNRFWQQFFGVGLVKTSEDFGAQGEWPSHPELLDYLAVYFIESGWDVKDLVKQIVMSETYKQSSQATTKEYEDDPENRLLARGPRFRMDSEMIRDQVLATSGLLNMDMFGKSVKPPQPPGLWKSVSMPSSYPSNYKPDTGNKIYRRSLYTFWKRGMPPPQMTILNAPSREACIARRERTNTPLQALLLMNEPEYLKAARHLAANTIADRSVSPQDWATTLYETITAKLPDEDESEALLAMAKDLQSIYQNNADLAKHLCDGAQLPEGATTAELAAWTMLASTIYNLDITKTLD
jgi:hypothetical protein